MTRTMWYKFAVVAAVAAGLALAISAPARAINVLETACQEGGGSDVCQAQGDDLFGAGGIWSNIISALIFVIGAVSVLMIIVGAIKYVTANGDQGKIESAKNTILYSVAGLILAIASGGIVIFVLDSF